MRRAIHSLHDHSYIFPVVCMAVFTLGILSFLFCFWIGCCGFAQDMEISDDLSFLVDD